MILKRIVFLFLVIVPGTLFLWQSSGAQSVTVVDHKQVPISKNTKLRIISQDGSSIEGRWHMETDEAICLKLNSGRQIIVDKTEISEIYHCKRLTNYGFYIGFMSGVSTTFLVLALSGSDEENDYLAAPGIGVLCGLLGAVIGTFHEDCQQIALEDLDLTINSGTLKGYKTIGLQLTYSF